MACSETAHPPDMHEMSGANLAFDTEPARMLKQSLVQGDEMLNSLGLPGRPEDTRVVVAMSGGVDSSVVAALLHREGYEVIGVTLQLYDHGAMVSKSKTCCAGVDIHDARRAAEKIGIPHYILDYESRFKEAVMDRFADSYMAGETPIPCVSCNQTVKFQDLLTTAKELGADALATGHYVRSEQLGNKRALYRPLDQDRDQSYFLFATTQEQLNFIRFPLGSMPKVRVRELAAEFGLSVAGKPDSQDICFVPGGNYAEVIKKLRPNAAEPGDIVHLDGTVLGRHEGIIHYTVGQRRGLGVATGDPLYVVRLDADGKKVVVGPREALETSKVFLREVNWIADLPLDEGTDLEIFAKVRSARPPALARLRKTSGEVYVDLTSGERGVAPGQACVFFDSDTTGARVLGGGWIDRTERTAPKTEGKPVKTLIRAG